jgi:hypothetical protein
MKIRLLAALNQKHESAGGAAAHFSKNARSGAPPIRIIQKRNGARIATPEKVATRQINSSDHFLQISSDQFRRLHGCA